MMWGVICVNEKCDFLETQMKSDNFERKKLQAFS